jgi:hypothetical protein
MDAVRFDALTRTLTAAGSRRRALALAVSGMLAPLLGLRETDARKSLKKCKKIDNKKKRKKCIKKAKRANLCRDGVKNGSETDVDCGGGTCPRCGAGQICNSRDDCATGRCVSTVCQQCANAGDCGFEANGATACACRTTSTGQKVCTNANCRFFAGGTCGECDASEQCAPAGDGNIECCLPCGAS